MNNFTKKIAKMAGALALAGVMGVSLAACGGETDKKTPADDDNTPGINQPLDPDSGDNGDNGDNTGDNTGDNGDNNGGDNNQGGDNTGSGDNNQGGNETEGGEQGGEQGGDEDDDDDDGEDEGEGEENEDDDEDDEDDEDDNEDDEDDDDEDDEEEENTVIDGSNVQTYIDVLEDAGYQCTAFTQTEEIAGFVAEYPDFALDDQDVVWILKAINGDDAVYLIKFKESISGEWISQISQTRDSLNAALGLGNNGGINFINSEALVTYGTMDSVNLIINTVVYNPGKAPASAQTYNEQLTAQGYTVTCIVNGTVMFNELYTFGYGLAFGFDAEDVEWLMVGNKEDGNTISRVALVKFKDSAAMAKYDYDEETLAEKQAGLESMIGLDTNESTFVNEPDELLFGIYGDYTDEDDD